MKKRWLFLFIFIITGIVMYFTNPDENAHKEAVSREVLAAIQEEKSESKTISGWFEKMAGNASDYMLKLVVKPVIDNTVSVENYVVFSLTRLKIQDIDRRVGIGLFGKVFIAPQVKTNIRAYIKEATGNSRTLAE